MALLSKVVSEATGYTQEEAKQILLKKINKDAPTYKVAPQNNSLDDKESWAAITLCYNTSDPKVFIKAIGKKKTPMP